MIGRFALCRRYERTLEVRPLTSTGGVCICILFVHIQMAQVLTDRDCSAALMYSVSTLKADVMRERLSKLREAKLHVEPKTLLNTPHAGRPKDIEEVGCIIYAMAP